jgi:hypothetical protein
VTPREVGHGVSVAPFGDGGWRVCSRSLALPWRTRAGSHPGSAVQWLGEPYEVVAEERSGSETWWILRPWPDSEVMRTAFRLDEAWVEALAAAEEESRRGRVVRWLSVPLAPLLAMAPARLQRQWHDSWGFPAVAATLVSAVLELAAGGVGVVQLLALTFGADWFLTGALRLVAVVGPALSVEALVRLGTAAARGEPMGSVAGLPLVLLFPGTRTPRDPPRPVVRLEDDESGALDVFSEVVRRDWVHDGVLRYRGRAYRLGGLEMLGSGWRYRFERIDDEAVGPPLRLTESNRRPEAADRDRPPSVIRTTMVTAAMCMSPRSYQERWAQHLGVRPVWFTLLGAGAELVGGWINLEHRSGDGGSSTLAVNLFFLVEAVTRLALLVSTGRPVGSVLGWAARPLLARMMPEGGDEGMRR